MYIYIYIYYFFFHIHIASYSLTEFGVPISSIDSSIQRGPLSKH